MAKKFLTSLKLVNLNSDPSVGSEGELYFNTSASVAKIYKNGAWSELAAGAGGGSNITVSTTEPVSPETGDAWYKNDTGEFYIYDGTYWVEVNGTISLTQEEVQDYVAPLFTHNNHVNASVHYEDELNELHIEVTSAPTAGFTSTLKHDVRLNGSIAKGQAVYVSSANGTNMIVSKASNASEQTSSKTLGLLETGGSNNSLVKVVTEGLLAGLDTSSAGSEGDPVWLGTDGNLIYGLANKPYAPAHLVFIGVVTRKNNSNGEIFVKVQNGFELEEIHNIGIGYGASIPDNQALVYNSSASLWYNEAIVNYLAGTGNQIDVSSNTGNITLSLPNELTAPGNLTVTGNLTVSGSTTYINTQTLNVEDNIITLNSNVTGSPTGTSGIEIERGTEPNKTILWTESNQSWVFDGDIRSYQIRSTDSFALDVASSGSLNGIVNISTDNAFISIDDIKTITLDSDGSSYKFTKDFIEFPDLSHQNTAFLGMSAYYTDDLDEGASNLYFTNERAVSALTSTLSNYLTLSSASSTYLTQLNATSTYLTQANASVIYQPIGSYLTSETDPVFSASDAASITSASISNWNTAYGWGNHAIAGYALSSHNHTLDSLSNVVITGTPTDGQAIVWDTTTSKWVNETVSGGASYPDQTGNNGKFLQTNGASVSWQNIDFTGYLTESSASSTYLTQASASSTYQPIGSYLTSESDTLETVTDRGATSSNAITISNTTESTTPTSGALIISGGVGIAKDVWIDGDLHVNGTTVTENTKTVATHDNMIYLNAELDSIITNAVFSSGSIIYTAENNYTAGMDIRITGVSPSAFNISTADLLTVASATPTQFVVVKSNPGASYISGGTAHAKEEVNPDLGFAGGYYSGGYAHAGLFRDASDGVFKFFQGYTPEPDEAVNIDTTHASFALANISIKGITLPDTTSNIAIGYLSGNFSGNSNYAFGQETLDSNTGGGNYGIGWLALASNTGAENYGIGKSALKDNTGNTNYAFGDLAGRDNTGSDNLFLGHEAGTKGTSINSGNYNVYIGKTDGLSTNNNIVIADNEGNLRAQYLSADFGWTLGTIYSATWNGSAIDYQYGGTGLTSLGTAGQVLTVNAGATALEWADASGGGSSFTNSSELAALLSDETGSGSVVFSASASLTAPTISGGTINNTSIGATTASTGKFTSVNLNGQAIMEASTGTSSATSSFDTTVYSSAEFIVYGSTSTGNYVSKVLMLARGTATPVITEYAILTQGTAPTVTITPSYSAPNAVLTVAVTSGTNIEIIATEVSI